MRKRKRPDEEDKKEQKGRIEREYMNVYNSWSSCVLVVLSSQSPISMREANNSTLWVKIMSIKNEATLSSSLFSFWCPSLPCILREEMMKKADTTFTTTTERRREEKRGKTEDGRTSSHDRLKRRIFILFLLFSLFSLPLFHSLLQSLLQQETEREEQEG